MASVDRIKRLIENMQEEYNSEERKEWLPEFRRVRYSAIINKKRKDHYVDTYDLVVWYEGAFMLFEVKYFDETKGMYQFPVGTSSHKTAKRIVEWMRTNNIDFA